MRAILIFMTLIILPSVVSAESPSLHHMKSHKAVFDYYERGPDGSLTKRGHWTDSVELDDQHIKRTVVRTPLSQPADLIRTVVASRNSLAPVYMQQRFGAALEGLFYAEVRDARLKQIMFADTGSQIREKIDDLPGPIVEQNLQGMLAAALVAMPQSTVKVKGYVIGAAPGTRDLTFIMHGEEDVTVMDQNLKAWKIEDPDSAWFYWVRADAPYLVKVEHPSPQGTVLTSFVTAFEFN